MGRDRSRSCPITAHPREGTVDPHITEAEARADIADMEPIMAIEGRQMSDGDKELLVDLIRGTKTFEEISKILAREAGYEID